jgi:nicotinamide-nucleotide amidase
MFDASSEEDAVRGAKQIFGVDWVLLVDGYPMLDKSSDKPQAAADVRLVVTTPEGEPMSIKTVMGGHPEVIQPRIGKAGMAWLRKILARA